MPQALTRSIITQKFRWAGDRTRARSHRKRARAAPTLVFACVLAAVLSCLRPAAAHAQAQATEATRQGVIEQQKQEKATQLAPPLRDRGDTIVTRAQSLFDPATPGVKLSFGGFRPGAGIAPGLAYTHRAGTLGRWNVKGAWSTKEFKLAEGHFDVAQFAGDRVNLTANVRWEDAPQLHYFGVGANSVEEQEASYALRSTEVGGSARVRVLHNTFAGGGVGYLDVRSGSGKGIVPPIDELYTFDTAPGLDARPAWVHSSAFVAYDWRESEGYTRRGGLYRIAFHDYRAMRSQPFTFQRLDLDARQFFPLVNENWVIALEARAQLTTSGSDQTIPYFMLPYIGGGDSLRGHHQYRFADRQSLLLRSELRWTASSVLDMAVFLDQGKVAAERHDLDFQGLKRGWGIGARLHGATGTGLRLEVARGAEGWRYHIAQTASF